MAINKSNYTGFLRELKTQNNNPKFVFSHLLLPHSPFYLDRHGNISKDSIYRAFNFYDKEKYLEQVRYANKLIKVLIESSNRDFSRPRVVIIASDHGFRVPNKARESHFMTLNTYYFSDHDYNSLYDSISPVNTFRIIFNKYFHTNLPLLKDSSIRMK